MGKWNKLTQSKLVWDNIRLLASVGEKYPFIDKQSQIE